MRRHEGPLARRGALMISEYAMMSQSVNRGWRGEKSRGLRMRTLEDERTTTILYAS